MLMAVAHMICYQDFISKISMANVVRSRSGPGARSRARSADQRAHFHIIHPVCGPCYPSGPRGPQLRSARRSCGACRPACQLCRPVRRGSRCRPPAGRPRATQPVLAGPAPIRMPPIRCCGYYWRISRMFFIIMPSSKNASLSSSRTRAATRWKY